jgi:NADH:ubiquinone oxidoreductase subunit F (NADH-binding)
MKTKPIQDVILTLQYCLETFEQTCQCGRCDPCTKGRKDIARAIRTMESLQLQQGKLSPLATKTAGGAK